MNHRPFEMLREMIDSLPPKAVRKAVAIERFMLEEDLAQGRTLPSDDTAAILTFCGFLDDATCGAAVMPPSMPMEHWAFYKRTVERLVAAEELPRKAKEDFEAANHDVAFCIMA